MTRTADVKAAASTPDASSAALPSLWERQARQWSRLTSPFRPHAEDTAVAQRAVDAWHETHRRPPRAVVLGATPELASLRWPLGSLVTALDQSEAVLRGVWQAASAEPATRGAIRGNWLEMPMRDASVDLVLGDGSFSLIRPHAAAALVRIVRGLMAEHGSFVLRVYARPDSDRGLDRWWTDAAAGRIRSFGAFKLRLLMAAANQLGEVSVGDVWTYVAAHRAELDRTAAAAGWSADDVGTLEAYRDQPSIYWFATLADWRATLASCFSEESCSWGHYEGADCCPTLVLRPRRNGA